MCYQTEKCILEISQCINGSVLVGRYHESNQSSKQYMKSVTKHIIRCDT